MREQPISALKGVGPKRAELFEKMQVGTVEDLLRLSPRDYQDFSKLQDPQQAEHGQWLAMEVELVSTPRRFGRNGMKIVSVTAAVGECQLQLVWFNQPYRVGQIHAGEKWIACGRIDRVKGLRMLNPALVSDLPGILPVYPVVRGLGQAQIRSAMATAISAAAHEMDEILPKTLRESYDLCDMQQAIHQVHFPADMASLLAARRRMDFESMLYYFVALEKFCNIRRHQKGKALSVAGLETVFLESLPFLLTNAQASVMQDISADMRKDIPMNRLVQGDVGSGKTVLAQYALFLAAQNNRQGVLMAPTDILARQHYQNMVKFFGNDVCLLTGKMSAAEKRTAYQRIQNGEVHIVVGTHAVLQQKVLFHDLAVVITDEQHRFGVHQRAVIAEKGNAPHVMIMSATPIPRTLALLVYGDLDISVVDEMPPGRKPVQTQLVPERKRQDMYAYLGRQVAQGKQAYVVCPLVEASESLERIRSAQDVFQELSSKLTVSVGLLHGRMSSAENCSTRWRRKKRCAMPKAKRSAWPKRTALPKAKSTPSWRLCA